MENALNTVLTTFLFCFSFFCAVASSAQRLDMGTDKPFKSYRVSILHIECIKKCTNRNYDYIYLRYLSINGVSWIILNDVLICLLSVYKQWDLNAPLELIFFNSQIPMLYPSKLLQI